MNRIRAYTACVSFLIVLLLTACGVNQTSSGGETSEGDISPTASVPVAEATFVEQAPTVAPPPSVTPTEAPLAARVNGEGILLADFETEVSRHETGFAIRGVDAATQGDYQAKVLEQMISDRLIVQQAQAQGFSISAAKVQVTYDQSVADAEGEDQFLEWLELNLYTPETFRLQLHDWLLADLVQNEIVEAVSESAEHVRARHILVSTEEAALAIQEQLAAGADFATLAVNNSQDQSTRINGGELGWFPRGVLTVPEVEDVAFGQDAGVVSDVVSTFLGFHIVETLEFDPDRSIAPEFRLLLQQASIEDWLADLRAQADIERYIS